MMKQVLLGLWVDFWDFLWGSPFMILYATLLMSFQVCFKNHLSKGLLFSLCNLRVHNYLKLMNSGSFRSFTNIKSGFSGISRFDGFNDMIHNFFLDQSDCTSTKTTTSHSRSINSIAF